MKRLDRYMFREMTVPFLIGLLTVVMMFAANHLIFVYKTFSMQSLPKLAVLQSVLYKIPAWLNQFTLPTATSLGASLAFSRLQRESELTALRANGARILRVVAPVAVFGLMVGVGNFLIGESIMPKAEKRFNDLATRLSITGAIPTFKERAILYLGAYTATFGMISKGDGDTLQLRDVVLFETPQPGTLGVFRAKNGRYERGLWILDNANYWLFDQSGDLLRFDSGKPVTINQKVVVGDLFSQGNKEERTISELMTAVRDGRRSGLNTTDLEVELHRRFAVPFSCVVFAIVGPVFAVLFARSGAFVGVLLSMILVMLYYNVHVISGEVLGKNGLVAPWLAAWLPNILFSVAGLFALRKLE